MAVAGSKSSTRHSPNRRRTGRYPLRRSFFSATRKSFSAKVIVDSSKRGFASRRPTRDCRCCCAFESGRRGPGNKKGRLNLEVAWKREEKTCQEYTLWCKVIP